jgi:hypothetical protein
MTTKEKAPLAGEAGRLQTTDKDSNSLNKIAIVLAIMVFIIKLLTL